MSSWLNILLVTAPLGILAHFLHWSPVAVFLLNFAALIPLALLLGEVTEDLAVRFGSTVGGLLNATFGNVVELILSIAALTKGLYVVIAASLIGSILSNLLLVLGNLFVQALVKHAWPGCSAPSTTAAASDAPVLYNHSTQYECFFTCASVT